MPRSKDKYLFEGKLWIDVKDYSVVRIEGHPAKKLSFWIQRATSYGSTRKLMSLASAEGPDICPGTALWKQGFDHRSPGLRGECGSEQGTADNRSRSRHRFDFVASDAKQPAVSGNIAVAQLSLSAQSTALPIRQRGPAQLLSHDNCVTVTRFRRVKSSQLKCTSLSTVGCARVHCISRFLNALKQIASDALVWAAHCNSSDQEEQPCGR